MNGYEITLIFDAILDDSDIANLYEKAKGIIQAKNGEIHADVVMGRRKLAYAINKKTHGYYHMAYVTGDGEMLNELNRQCNYDASILKCYVVKTEDLTASKEALEALLKDPEMNANLYTQSSTREM